jgi:hypothetical protein
VNINKIQTAIASSEELKITADYMQS